MSLKFGFNLCLHTHSTTCKLSFASLNSCLYSNIEFKGWSHCCLDTPCCSMSQILLNYHNSAQGRSLHMNNSRSIVRESSMMHHWQNYSLLYCSKLRRGKHLFLHNPGDKTELIIKDDARSKTAFQPGTWILSLNKIHQKLRGAGLFVCFPFTTVYQHKYHFLR